MEQVILVRIGEIHLKGLNRPFFENRLVQNIKEALKDMTFCKVEKSQSRFFVRQFHGDASIVAQRIARVFGVHSVSVASMLPRDIEMVYEEAIRMMQGKKGTFKVLARRADKRFPLNSMDIAKEAGGRILDAVPALTVDVHHPQFEVNIEIRDYAYVYADIIKGVGGMPVGTNGKACLLLSGGIDSPVAGYMVAKRGVAVQAVHFYSFPYTSERAKEKVIDLARLLAGYCGKFTLCIVPFTEIQREIHEKCPQDELVIIMRRFMMRIAERLAIKLGAKALVTGESIGQVASQTLESLYATNAVVQMPVFRPVIGMDKTEITERAVQIGTYQTSILPYEDCCTVFVPKHPVTHPKVEKIEKSELVLDIEKFVTQAVETTEFIDILPSKQ